MAAKQRKDIKAGIFSTSVPQWYHDARVSLITGALNEAKRHADSSNVAEDGKSGGENSAAAPLRQELDAAAQSGSDGRAEILELITGAIITAVAEMLIIDSSGVNRSKSVAEHGVDSLTASELRNWFHRALGVNLQMQNLLDAHTSINTLTTTIVDKVISA